MDVAETAAITTPVSLVRIEARGDRLTGIAIDPAGGAERDGGTPVLRDAVRQLRDYFAGTRETFDLPLAPASTRRGEELRAALIAIPCGETRTYGAVAIERRSSARAIGGVCRTNPFPIVVPCHRVVSAGATEFYSAGAGPDTKAWLLAHERHWRDRWVR